MVNPRGETRIDSAEREIGELKESMGGLGEQVVGLGAQIAELTKFMAEMQENWKRDPQGSPKGFNDRASPSGQGGRGGVVDGGEVLQRKLELPIFYGEDPYGWIYRAERYFAINGLTEIERVRAAGVCMDGVALNWLQWMEMRSPIASWTELKVRLLECFRPSQEGSTHEELLSLRQEGSVAEYRAKFEMISAPLRDMSDALMMGAFINGLREEIKAEIRLLGARDLGQLMLLAQKIEDRNEAMDRLWEGRGVKPKTGAGGKTGFSSGYSFLKSSVVVGSRASLSPSFNTDELSKHGAELGKGSSTTRAESKGAAAVAHGETGRKETRFRRLSDAEYQDRLAKGLCFRCDEKYSRGHRCQSKQLQVIIVESTELEEWEGGESGQEDEAEEMEANVLELSATYMMGLTSLKTFVRKVG